MRALPRTFGSQGEVSYMKRWSTILGLTALGILILGCGSDGQDTISTSVFIVRANHLCWKTIQGQTSAYKRIAAEAEESNITAADGRRSEQEVADAVVKSVKRMIGEFQSLGVPSAKESAVSRMLAEYEKGAKNTRANPQVFLRAEAFQAADATAVKLGLVKCRRM
jgi:hypothetical protein